jgi:hypothetical protein
VVVMARGVMVEVPFTASRAEVGNLMLQSGASV